GTSIYDDSVAPGFCDIFVLAPPTGDETYIQWLLDTIRKYQIDLIIPGIEIDVFRWIEHVSEIEKSGAIALLNNMELIQLCKDKWVFYENLKSAGVVDIPDWRFIQRLGDLRNLCDHNKDREPTKDEINELIDGVEKITKTLF
ncbi:MAG: hypothetical protein IIC22_07890, partial [Chloroflexi bacterium]|nr:hypothetical protein [Chloroflexota bacterium]